MKWEGFIRRHLREGVGQGQRLSEHWEEVRKAYNRRARGWRRSGSRLHRCGTGGTSASGLWTGDGCQRREHAVNVRGKEYARLLVEGRLIFQDDVVGRPAGPEEACVRLEVEVLVARVRDVLVDQQPSGAVPGLVAVALARGVRNERE